ncbi:MAG: D-glycerate dehydrogenase [Flavobacteriaceae bacterium]|nr:MAG: D-glycerate dehydrogenase [Flavobacteriaceae bacterium]
MKVLVCLNIPDVGVTLMKKAGLEVTKWTNDLPMTATEFNNEAKKHDVLLSTSNYIIDRDFLSENSHLQMISQFAVGYDNIDISAAKSLNILVGNAPNAMTDATADIAFGLMLATSRKMFFMHKTIIDDNWGHFKPRANLGLELKNKTVGIFGLGTIGLEFAKRCKGAYNMEVIYCNRTPNTKAEKELNAKKVSFNELLERSDVLSLHCALTEETNNKFDATTFKKMKSSALFINTSRGGVHNETDLINALNEKEIWGAGLDVTNPEPMHKNNPLLQMENVSVLPHIGSTTVEARDRMSVYAAQNLIAFYKGENIPYQIS